MDGPWDNATWKGKKIEKSKCLPVRHKLSHSLRWMSAHVDGLSRKHAIYLVAEGSVGEELFDLTGLGFSSVGKKIVRPVVPSVSISVDGKAIELPKTPVRSTNANGITDYKTYEVVYVLPSETSRLPKVSASSDNKDVKVEVKQARPDAETAVVTFDYQGLAKTYNVVFSRSLW